MQVKKTRVAFNVTSRRRRKSVIVTIPSNQLPLPFVQCPPNIKKKSHREIRICKVKGRKISNHAASLCSNVSAFSILYLGNTRMRKSWQDLEFKNIVKLSGEKLVPFEISKAATQTRFSLLYHLLAS